MGLGWGQGDGLLGNFTNDEGARNNVIAHVLAHVITEECNVKT